MQDKVKKTNAIRLLESKKIPFELSTFAVNDEHVTAVEVAQLLNVDEKLIYKTLVAVGNKTGPVIAVIPGHAELDLKALARVSQNKNVDMLHLDELEKTTGYIRGGCSPIGMKKHFPTYIDTQIEDLDYVFVSAGRRGLQMKLKPKDLIQISRAKLEHLVHKTN